MLPGLQVVHSLGICRAIHVVCMMLVLSYILFNVLDLDGSNFPRLLIPVGRSVIVAEVPCDVEFVYSLDRAELWKNTSDLSADGSGAYGRLQRTEVPRSSPLDSGRTHGYRVGLPRDSIADLSPYG